MSSTDFKRLMLASVALVALIVLGDSFRCQVTVDSRPDGGVVVVP